MNKFSCLLFALLLSGSVISQTNTNSYLINDLSDYLFKIRAHDQDNDVFLFAFNSKGGKLAKASLIEIKDSIHSTLLQTEAFVKYEKYFIELSNQKLDSCQTDILVIVPFITKKVDPNVDKLVISYPEYVLKNYSRMLEFLSKQPSSMIILKLQRITTYPDEF